jgi:hypothetical protein
VLGRVEVHTGFWCGDLRERGHLLGTTVGATIILKWIFRSGLGHEMNWFDLGQSVWDLWLTRWHLLGLTVDARILLKWFFRSGLSYEMNWFGSGQSVWDLWLTRWHCDRFFTEYSAVTMSVSFHHCSIIIHSWHRHCVMLATDSVVQWNNFLGAFAKVRKATTVLASSCPSVRSHGTSRLPLDGFWWNVMSSFRKSVKKVEVWLKSNKNYGYFTWRPVYNFWCDIFR